MSVDKPLFAISSSPYPARAERDAGRAVETCPFEWEASRDPSLRWTPNVRQPEPCLKV
jgi:hypothetical protein